MELSEDDKNSIHYLVTRQLGGRAWWKEYVASKHPTDYDKQKILYAFKYTLSEFYGIDNPRDMLLVTDDMVEKTGLKPWLEKYIMKDAPEIAGVDMKYITYRIFPKYFDHTDVEKKLVQNYYNEILDGTKKLSKQYFCYKKDAEKAKKRAIWWLEVMLNSTYTSIEEMYQAFSSNDILVRLKNAKLQTAYLGCEYQHPIDYLHDCISSSPKHTEEHELLYQITRYHLQVAANLSNYVGTFK